jgi:hypothetical protein
VESNDVIQSALISGGFCCIVIIMLFFNETVGKRKHKTILDGEVFRPFKRELGFEKEELNQGKYHGYKGVYKKYFFRIFYDWNTTVTSNRTAWREVCVMLYFEPKFDSSDDLDTEYLDSLNRKYKDKNLITIPRQKIIVEVSHIRLYRIFNLLTRFSHLKKKLDQLVEIAEKEGLKPICEKDVNHLISQDPYLHGPSIESFTDGIEEE